MPRPVTTLCWHCRRSTNSGCSWSASLQPVPGWTADYAPVLMPKGRGVRCRMVPKESYLVRACPLYQPDPPRRAARKERGGTKQP